MRNTIAALVLLATSSSAFAFQTPVQQSAAATKAVIDVILSSDAFSLLSITKISINSQEAKVELRDRTGKCIAVPLTIKNDPFGEPGAQLMVDSLAVCD